MNTYEFRTDSTDEIHAFHSVREIPCDAMCLEAKGAFSFVPLLSYTGVIVLYPPVPNLLGRGQARQRAELEVIENGERTLKMPLTMWEQRTDTYEISFVVVYQRGSDVVRFEGKTR
jgi:hypothetical protein